MLQNAFQFFNELTLPPCLSPLSVNIYKLPGAVLTALVNVWGWTGINDFLKVCTIGT